jgi:predicted transcriptional regulator
MAEVQMRLRFNPRRKGLVQVFGPLEAEIMREVWGRQEATVKQIHRILAKRREIAYTTVMTTMSRLAEKGILERTRQGMAYLYRPVMSKSEFDQWVLRSVLSGLLESFDTVTVDYLVEFLSEERPEQLSYLREVLEMPAA